MKYESQFEVDKFQLENLKFDIKDIDIIHRMAHAIIDKMSEEDLNKLFKSEIIRYDTDEVRRKAMYDQGNYSIPFSHFDSLRSKEDIFELTRGGRVSHYRLSINVE